TSTSIPVPTRRPQPRRPLHPHLRRARFGPDPTSVSAAAPNHVPIPGTAVVVEVAEADGWYAEDGDRHFNGYLVDLERMEA
ncbi:hypothetical protein, partial [uncultured Nocardioides sp.]|uniref:hypothetical protein n=1 Tax=uncultured Nocardioides sp. TaxID=198441 RepID=UPI002639D28A